jgi:hypothetical protein
VNRTVARRSPFMRIQLFVFSTILAFLEGGCGDLLDPDHPGEPLWTLPCRIQNSQEVPVSNLRVAFLWNLARSQPDPVGEHGEMVIGGVARIAQDLALEPDFPARFTLRLYDLPPAEAMHPGEEFQQGWEGVEVAHGELVIYEDRNTNDALDMLTADATETVDLIVGPAELYRFLVIKGNPDGLTLEEQTIEAGLNVFLPNGFLVDEQGRPTMPLEDWLKNPVLDITLVEDPDRQYLMCLDPVNVHYDLDTDPVMCQPIPEDADVYCLPDGRTYEARYYACRQESVCGPKTCGWFYDICPLAPDDPVPEDWPCS